MKKGFSLVELILVFLIIGIILALSVKGADIIDGARLRSDVSSLRNFETGFSVFYLKNNSFSDETGFVFAWNGTMGDPTLITDRLIEARIVNKLDVPIKSYAEPKNWQFSAFVFADDTGTNRFLVYSSLLTDPEYNATLFFSESRGPNYAIGAFGMLSPKLICHIEWILDDSLLVGGSGRLVMGTKYTITDSPDISSCDAASKVEHQPYLYLIFSSGTLRPVPRENFGID